MKIKYVKGYALLLVSALLIIIAAVGYTKAQIKPQLEAGSGMFTMPEKTGVNNDDLRVFYYRPTGWTPDKPIVIVMHGVKRNAEVYRDGWLPYAEKYNLLVVCPEFSEEKYPGVGFYNLGNIAGSDGGKTKFQPRDKWVFSVIDHVFNEVRARTGATSDTFTLFGHSAGAQLVHRYAFFAGETKAARIISADAGWYTMPDTTIAFPYGMKKIPISNEDLAKDFAKPVTILLGEKDNNPNDKVLRHTSQSNAQGLNRLERGENFFKAAKEKAAELGVPFNWKLVTVPGVAHDDAKMAAAAAKLIAGENK